MLNLVDIKKAFTDLVGFSDDMSSHTQLLQIGLKHSTSGATFQDAHPLITLQILEEIAPKDLTIARFVDAVIGSYAAGSIIKYDNTLYEAKIDTTFTGAISSDWEETSVFSIWLKAKVQSSISKVVQTVLAQSAIDLDARDTLAEATLFNGAGYIKDIIPNNNNIVGLVLEQKISNGIGLKINRIGFQCTKSGAITLYIFHSSKSEPVKVINLLKIQDNSFEWINIDDLVLSQNLLNPNGYWLLAYNQDELDIVGNNAIKNAINTNCISCGQNISIQPYIDISAFASSNTTFSQTLWDQATNIYYNDTNFGLNLDISVVCDFTEIFLKHKSDFVNLIKLQFAVDMLKEYVYNANARVNRTAAIVSRADVIYALDGDNSKFSRKSGLAYDLERLYNVFKINTKGFNTRCLPCNKSGIKYKTIL